MKSTADAHHLDTVRMDADFENKCRTWIQAYRAHSDDGEAAISRHAALADFVDCVAGYIRSGESDPLLRHDAVVQAKATIQYLEPHRPTRSVLIEEFYYGLVMKMLDEQFGNSMPKTDVDTEIDRFRQHTIRLTSTST